MPALRPLARVARPTLIGATALAALAAGPGAAQAAPFNGTFQYLCNYVPEGSPAGTAGPQFSTEVTFDGNTRTIDEGQYLALQSGSVNFKGTGLNDLSSLGETVTFAPNAALSTVGANRLFRPYVNFGAAPLTLTPNATSYTIPASTTTYNGYAKPVVTGPTTVTLRGGPIVGRIVATTGETTSNFTVNCRVAPAVDPTIAELAVTPRATPVAPEIDGLEYRNTKYGGSVDIHGTFYGPVTGVDFGGTPATGFTKVSLRTVRATFPSLPDAENVRIRVTNAAGESPDTAADDFDVIPIGGAVDVENVCAPPGAPTRTARIVTQYRFDDLPSSVRPGDTLSVKPTVTVRYPSSTLDTWFGDTVREASSSVKNLRLGVTGATSGDVTLAQDARLGDFPLLGDGPEFALDAPSTTVSLGTVGAPIGSSVVLRPGTFQLTGEISGADWISGLPIVGQYTYDCTPTGQTFPEGGTVGSIRVDDQVGPTPTPTPTATPTPTPTPTATPEPTPTATPEPTPAPEDVIPYSYSLAGAAQLKTLTKGSLPLSGGIDANLSLPSGNFTGTLTLAPTQGNLTALGFLPVTAKVNLVPTDKVTGSLKNGKLNAVAKVRIKLPSVKALGIELAGGANCQAKQISSISLVSTQPTFMPLSGGPIAGSFAISDLSGCGFLTGIVSPLTSGSGNTIALNLTKK